MKRKTRKKCKYENIRFALLFVAAILIIWLAARHSAQATVECRSDNDCATGGCSGEICGPKEKVKNIVTACIYKPEYVCLQYTSCKCIQGKCQWERTKEYEECLKNVEKMQKVE